MIVHISFEPNHILTDVFTLEGDWTFPCLPRVGDEISPAVLMDWISPMELYESLIDEEKRAWVDWVAEDVEYGAVEEEAQQENLRIWLGNLGSTVSEVCWSKYDGQNCVLITLKR